MADERGEMMFHKCDAGHYYVTGISGGIHWSPPSVDCPWCKLDATGAKLAQYAQAAMAPDNEVRKRVHELEAKSEEELFSQRSTSATIIADIQSCLDAMEKRAIAAEADLQTSDGRLEAISNAISVDAAETDWRAHMRTLAHISRILSPDDSTPPERVVENRVPRRD
jgi:hypothetical protein